MNLLLFTSNPLRRAHFVFDQLKFLEVFAVSISEFPSRPLFLEIFGILLLSDQLNGFDLEFLEFIEEHHDGVLAEGGPEVLPIEAVALAVVVDGLVLDAVEVHAPQTGPGSYGA